MINSEQRDDTTALNKLKCGQGTHKRARKHANMMSAAKEKITKTIFDIVSDPKKKKSRQN